ncbi:MAG: tyrosine-type recombinase/integrase [Bryobacterales bacterium]|nr:tyrosine-type recombinase/integrase [Bryobacterales bacterium]
MLTLYRRHLKACGQTDRYYRRCKCPVWVEGTKDDGEYIRHTLKLTSWERAEEKKRELEAGTASGLPVVPTPLTKEVTVREATAKFLAECEARNLSEATSRKYRLLAKLINAFSNSRFPHLRDFSVERIRDFRKSWKDGPRAAGKKLERLRAFFKFCVENQWIEVSPVASLKAPLVKDKPTMPFTREEMARILEHAGSSLAFILTLRYTGMRISDAAMLRADSVNGNRVFLYTQKTGVPVHVPVPDSLTNLLAGIKPVGGYLFLRGESTRLDTCTDLWRRQLAKVFKAGEIKGGHPHRFRDTFAVELLQSGVPIEHVSILLGHSSIKVTERHYAPWVKTRQDMLEEEVRRTWEQQKPRLVKA